MSNAKMSAQNKIGVIPSIASFLEEAAFQDEIKQLPLTVQEMFEDILDTESGNDLTYRRRILACLNITRSFASSMEPFTNEQIIDACRTFKAHE